MSSKWKTALVALVCSTAVLTGTAGAAPPGVAELSVNDPAQASALRSYDAYAAWAVTMGDPRVTIAIVDSGTRAVDDLRANLGSSWNVATNGPNADDGNGHGTAVASVAGASANNGLG